MSLLIQGPKQPGNDIGVYLEPLIDDMIDLWDKGVEVYNAYKKDRFKLSAMNFYTISDFPTYGNLSGYGTKGEKRYMGFLKGYVRNRSRPKGSIVEGYVSEEVVSFCTSYIDGIPYIGVPESRHEGRLEGKGTIGCNDVTLNNDDLEQAHFIVLQNMSSIAPYIHEHMLLLKRNNNRQGLHWLEIEHTRTFSNWLRDTVKSRYPNVVAKVTQLVKGEEVLDVVKGEEEEDTFMVVKIFMKIIRFNIMDKSFKEIFDLIDTAHGNIRPWDVHRYTKTLTYV
nr:hypothetical protein [Tanacetum cinerariifolium]